MTLKSLLVHLKLPGLGIAAADNLIRQARQLGRIEAVRLGTWAGLQLVEEGDRLLRDVLMALVLDHAGHVTGGYVGQAGLQAEVVVVGGEQGAAAPPSQVGYDRTGDGCSVWLKIKN